MAREQPPEPVSFKCSYCGSPMSAVYTPFHVTETCPSCRGSVPIPRPQTLETSASQLPGANAKVSGEWPAGHYARPGAHGLKLDPPSPDSQRAPEPDSEEKTVLPPPNSTPTKPQRLLRRGFEAEGQGADLFEKIVIPANAMPLIQPAASEPEPKQPAAAPRTLTESHATPPGNASARPSDIFPMPDFLLKKRSDMPNVAPGAIASVPPPPPKYPGAAEHPAPPHYQPSENRSDKLYAVVSSSDKIPIHLDDPKPGGLVDSRHDHLPAASSIPAPQSMNNDAPEKQSHAAEGNSPSPDLTASKGSPTESRMMAIPTGPIGPSRNMDSTLDFDLPPAATPPAANLDAAPNPSAESTEPPPRPTSERRTPPPPITRTIDQTAPWAAFSTRLPEKPKMEAPKTVVPPPQESVDVARNPSPFDRSFDIPTEPRPEKPGIKTAKIDTPPPPELTEPARVPSPFAFSTEERPERPGIKTAKIDTPPPPEAFDPDRAPSPFSRPMDERPDPNARRATGMSPSMFDPTYTVPVTPDALDKGRKSKPSGWQGPRWTLIAASVLVVMAAGGWIGYSVLNGMARTQRQNNIKVTMDNAAAAFKANDVVGAAVFAQSAKAYMSLKDVELDPEFKAANETLIKNYTDAGALANQLDHKLAEWAKDPAAVRRDFEEKKVVFGHLPPDQSGPLLALLAKKTEELDKNESDQKLVKLNEKLTEAERLYTAQKVEEAGKAAEQIVAAMSAKPAVQDDQLKKRAEILAERAGRLAEAAKRAVASKGEELTVTRKFLQGEIEKLDAKNFDLKPLVDQYTLLLAKVGDQESEFVVKAARSSLEDANKLYKQVKIAEAAKLAARILESIPPKLAAKTAEIQKRAEILVQRGTRLAELGQIRAAAKGEKVAEAKALIQQELGKLDMKDPDQRPMAEEIAVLSESLVQEERAVRQKARKSKDTADHTLNSDDAGEIWKRLRRFAELDDNCKLGELDYDGYLLTYSGKEYRLCIHHDVPGKAVWFLDAGDNRIELDPRHFDPAEKDKTFRPRFHRALYHAMALADAMKNAGVKSDEIWDSKEEAPFVSARRIDKQGNEYIFLNDRLYTGKAQEKLGRQSKADDEFRAKTEALAKAVENDAPTSNDIRQTIAFAVRAAAVEADWNDHLEGEYVRKVIDEGYIENNMPGSNERLKKELADFRAGYKMISEPFVNFKGTCPDGEVAELRTYEDRAVWRIYDNASNTTTFAITNPDDEKDCLFILYDYPGRLNEMPDGKPATRVRMTHQAVGVISWYDPATNEMDFDPKKWDFASTLEVTAISDARRVAEGYGTAAWALPPHVLLIDKSGRTKALVTPYGRVDVQDFKLIADPTKRKAAMDAFLDRLITVLPNKPEGSYQHLYFRYFFQYILDSPVTDHLDLLGSRAHMGDIHQTTYQSLERFMGGRYVGDCDDIAEMYMTLERKMGKLAYVMSLPGHAACGWVEKKPDESLYTFYILQTGPPRRFEDITLDKVVEKAYRAFDPEGTQHFDPKSLAYNFRFNNEPTRTTYWLSTRMYVDAAYGEAMEKVQSYWHFHFYALGIETMKAMIEKGDTVSENWNEIAGLYGQVREVEDSIRCSHESIKNLRKDEILSRMSEEYRIAAMWRSEHDNDKAYAAIVKTLAELKRIQRTQATFDYLGMRMQVAGLLLSLDRPWDCWDLLHPDIDLLGNPGNYFLKLEHVGVLTSAYLKMCDSSRGGKVLTAAEQKQKKELAAVLDRFYSRGNAIFEDSDGLDDYMRKYAYIGVYYAGKYGRKKYLEELLKDGPYPDPAVARNHQDRSKPEALLDEDWKWIRLSLSSYSIAIGDAIDLDDPPENWRVDEAVKLCDQMAKVGIVAAKYGSLAAYDFVLLSNRVLRDFLVKDWKDLEEVVKETAKRDWATLTSDVGEMFGRGARFCTPEEFATQYRMFTKYIKSKPSYFTVVYEAFRADGFKHAVLASKIALECNPGDKDMKREADYLEKLADKKIKLAAEKEAKDKADKERAEKDKPKKETKDSGGKDTDDKAPASGK